MVEDLNMILNLGDVPNLYPADEKAEILEKMQGIAKDMVRFAAGAMPAGEGNGRMLTQN